MCIYMKGLFIIIVIVINFLISLKTNTSNIEMHIIHFQIEKQNSFFIHCKYNWIISHSGLSGKLILFSYKGNYFYKYT